MPDDGVIVGGTWLRFTEIKGRWKNSGFSDHQA
jgi:hypothetical protein